MTSFWHPFAAMGEVAGRELVIERGDGIHVWDDTGKRYVDGTAALWFCNVGYGRDEIHRAIAEQLDRIPSFHTFGDFSNAPAEQLAARIAAISPDPNSKVFFTSGGSDAIDTAAKMARRYFDLTGEPDRTVLITREWAYHGMHGFGTSLAGIAGNDAGYGPLMPDVVRVRWDSVEDLADTIDAVGAHRIAGFYCEPVIGAGGIRVAPEGYLKEARRIVEAAGGLFIADEVITGFCRAGDWFASSRFSLQPDLITFAKGVTSGYLPMGGVIASPRVARPFFAEDAPMFKHGYTFSAHATVAAAALANIAILEREGLAAHVLALEPILVAMLDDLTDHPLVAGHRSGVGLLGAVVLDPERLAADEGFHQETYLAIREAGLISRAIGGDALQLSPSLVATEGDIEQIGELLRRGLDSMR
jgi:adenosylmethionine-8-amino-7-oxononanoate aminotransferase